MFNQTPNSALGALPCEKQAAFSKMVFRGWKWWYASLNGCWMRPPLAPLSDCSQWLNLNNVWMWGCICTLYSFTRVEERICVPMHINICEYGDTPCVVYVKQALNSVQFSFLRFPTQTSDFVIVGLISYFLLWRDKMTTFKTCVLKEGTPPYFESFKRQFCAF